MLVEAPVGNILGSPDIDPVDWLDLTWAECRQRALHKQTRSGQDVRILLRLGVVLRHGDILHRDASTVAVNLEPCTVLIAHPTDPANLAAACYELGNLHAPIQLENGRIIVIPDGPIEAVFQSLGIPWETEIRRFEPTQTSPGYVMVSPQFSLNRRPAIEHPTPQTAPLPRA